MCPVRRRTEKEETKGEAYTDAHPMEDEPTNQTPVPFDWAMDVNESNGLSPVVSIDARPTKHTKVMAKAPAAPTMPVAYSPCDLSALWLGTQNPWATLSCCHHHPQPPHKLTALSLAT